MPDPKVQDTNAKAKSHRAEIAEIDFGSFKILGLLLQDATFAVAVSQIAELFQLDKTIATRELKALLGADLQLDKVASKVHPKAVNCISLSQFETVIAELSFNPLQKNGNPRYTANTVRIAQSFARLSIGMTLQQRFSDAFGIKFDKEDRDAWFKAREIGIFERNNLTDGILRYIKANPDRSEAYQKFVYANCSDALNLALTGQKAKYWRDSLGLASNGLRDVWSEKMLDRLKTLEELAGRKIDKGLEPLEAVKAAIEAIDYPVLPVDKLFKPNPNA